MDVAVEERSTSLSSLNALDATENPTATIIQETGEVKKSHHKRVSRNIYRREQRNAGEIKAKQEADTRQKAFSNYLEERRAKRREREEKKKQLTTQSLNVNAEEENKPTEETPDEGNDNDVAIIGVGKDLRYGSAGSSNDEGIHSTAGNDDELNDEDPELQAIAHESEGEKHENDDDIDEGRGSIAEYDDLIAEPSEALNDEQPVIVEGFNNVNEYKNSLTDDLAADFDHSLFESYTFGGDHLEKEDNDVENEEEKEGDENDQEEIANDDAEPATEAVEDEPVEETSPDTEDATEAEEISDQVDETVLGTPAENEDSTEDSPEDPAEEVNESEAQNDEASPETDDTSAAPEVSEEADAPETTIPDGEISETGLTESTLGISQRNKSNIKPPTNSDLSGGARSFFRNKNLANRLPISRRQGVNPLSQQKEGNKPQMKSSVGRNRMRPSIMRKEARTTGHAALQLPNQADLKIDLSDINAGMEKIESYRSSVHQETNRDDQPVEERLQNLLSESQSDLHMRRPKAPHKRVQLPDPDPTGVGEEREGEEEVGTEVWVPEEDKLYVYKYSSEPRVLQMKSGSGRVASLSRWDNDPNSSFNLKLR